MNPRWLVIWTRDADPPEILMYEDEDEARAVYAHLTTQWSGVLLCRVERDAGLPQNEQPEVLRGQDEGR